MQSDRDALAFVPNNDSFVHVAELLVAHYAARANAFRFLGRNHGIGQAGDVVAGKGEIAETCPGFFDWHRDRGCSSDGCRHLDTSGGTL